MADLFELSDLQVDDVAGNGPGDPVTDSILTGDLRRKYSFGSGTSDLAIAQDPFFRFVSMVGKSPTDDPQFKFTERRGSFHKRYAYAVAAYDSDSTWVTTSDLGAAQSLGSVLKVRMATDYKNSGNIQNVFGNTGNEIKIGADGTLPSFFLEDQLLRLPVAESAAGDVAGYMVGKVNSVTSYAKAGDGNDATGIVNNPDMVELNLTIIRLPSTTANSQFLTALANSDDQSTVTPADDEIHSELEQRRCYVMGTAHAEGSGYPETWMDQPFTTGYGQTQIWKTAMAMTNTARATSLKYDQSEWARVWKQKLIEHKWDIEQSLLFGSQYSSGGINYTQGAVDYVLGYGNHFSWTTSKSQDDFLDDMSNYLDPRYNNGKATVFMVSTDVYNWLHKLGGYFSSNLDENTTAFRADLAVTGRKKVLGLDTTVINTVYGDMNLVRNIHLDGTNVKILAIDMNHAKYRPLVGNGVERDTSIYVGVQTLENSGVDRRVDLILTEAGMEWQMPEGHAIWTQG